MIILSTTLAPADFSEGRYREKPHGLGKCTTLSRYVFNWETLVEANNAKYLPVQKGVLRAYIQAISRHFAEGESILVNVTATVNFYNGNSTEDAILAGQHQLNVTMDSNDFVELEITEGLQDLWSLSYLGTDKFEIEVNLLLSVDCEHQKKVPITFINPAEIPLNQETRRARHSNLQPLLVVYLSDEEAKQKLKDEQRVPEEGDDVSSIIGRRRRTPSDSCHLQNFSLSFVDIQLYNILSPPTVNIRQCVGFCSHTDIKRNTNLANNHAKVMASAQVSWQLTPENWMDEPGEPCCVPTVYSSLYIIVLHRNQAIELSLYPEFVADECGCR